MAHSKYSPITEDDQWFIGSFKNLRFGIVKADETGLVAQDITGWGLQWVLRQSPRSGVVFIDLTTDDAITIVDGPNGLCQVEVTAADTLLITPGDGEYWHTLKRTDAGAEDVVVFGEARIRYGATR